MRVSILSPGLHGNSKSSSGMATIIVVTLLAIILLYVAYNARTLYHLGRELKVLNQVQVQRLTSNGSRTNGVTPKAQLPVGQVPPTSSDTRQ